MSLIMGAHTEGRDAVDATLEAANGGGTPTQLQAAQEIAGIMTDSDGLADLAWDAAEDTTDRLGLGKAWTGVLADAYERGYTERLLELSKVNLEMVPWLLPAR